MRIKFKKPLKSKTYPEAENNIKSEDAKISIMQFKDNI